MIVEKPALLITDDDRDFRETLRDVFEPRGFRTLLAHDGEQALDIVVRESIHLVLTDMHMPQLSGLETIRRIRKVRSKLPCILLSAAPNERLVWEAHQASVFSFLPKPVSFREITRIVSQAMRVTYDWP